MKADLKQPAWPGSEHKLEEFAWGIQDIQGRDYITVDARLAMARVEHREAGGKLEILTSEIRPDVDRKGDKPMLVVQVTLDSSIYGRAVGTATADIGEGARAVDATNPVENAETSALGRALGMYGYGLIQGQSGIASHNEVQDAIQRKTGASRASGGSQSASSDWVRFEQGKYLADCVICGKKIAKTEPRFWRKVDGKSQIRHIECEELPQSDAFPAGDDYEDDDPLAMGPV